MLEVYFEQLKALLPSCSFNITVSDRGFIGVTIWYRNGAILEHYSGHAYSVLEAIDAAYRKAMHLDPSVDVHSKRYNAAVFAK